MAKFVDLDKREELVEAMTDLFSSCHFKHKTGCLPPDCKECVDRFFKYYGHLLPEEDVKLKTYSSWELIKTGNGVFDYYFRCKRCHGNTPDKAYPIAPDFCPHCGAEMNGDDDND